MYRCGHCCEGEHLSSDRGRTRAFQPPVSDGRAAGLQKASRVRGGCKEFRVGLLGVAKGWVCHV